MITIDTLCAKTTNAETLNAFHACRTGHPWNFNNAWCWRNAHAMACQRRFYFSSADIDWLAQQADKEAHAADIACQRAITGG